MRYICPLFWALIAGSFILIKGQASGNQPPRWQASSYDPLTRGVSEATPVGSVLTILICIDPDGDLIVYGKVSGNAVGVYPNGTVTLAVQLIFGQKDSLGYDLTFSCVDVDRATGKYLHQLVTTNVQISVNDANDHPAVFQVDNAQGYAFTIPEDVLVGTLVEDVIQTVDLDRTVNAALQTMYLICNSPNATERANLPETSIKFCRYFKLNYTQVSEGIYNASIYVIASLDYETDPVFISKIVAIDGPGLTVQFTSTVNIQINILDRQDQPPVFLNPRDVTTISEGTPVGTTINFGISARDGDTGDRRPVALSIFEDYKNYFSLTPAVDVGNGIYVSKLIVRNQLDRETNLVAYTYIVKATELDKNTSAPTTATATATYSVNVGDINDNGPRFSQDLYVINVTEIDSTVITNTSTQITGLHILCSDPDEPSNAKYNVTIVRQTIGLDADAINVTDAYSISPNLEFFTGNASMFLKVDNPKYLDYDIPRYRVQTVVLVAREIGTVEMHSATTTIIIYLQDINDNSPMFNSTDYNISLRENSPYPMDVTKFTARDIDSGLNGQITYRLEGGFAGTFDINPTTGVLRLIGPLDYETTSGYVFLVIASDQGSEPRSTQAQVTVNVLNENDNAPRFRQTEYRTSVNESSLVFLNPITVQAVDNEVGTNQITYDIVSGQSPDNAFVLNRVTGELTLNKFLDYTSTPKDAKGNNTGVFVLVISASDNGNPPQNSTVNVYVTVIDENNHPPELTQSIYNVQLNETVKPGTPVVKIEATDSDAGDNGKVTCRLGQGATDNFAVNESNCWVIVGSAPFDYDVQRDYTLLIIVTDLGAPQKSVTATVYVEIKDNNNKDPFFDKLLYLENVDDRTPVNTTIFTVTARDLDSTNNLVYSIVESSIVASSPTGSRLDSTFPYDYRQAFGVGPNGEIYIKNRLNSTIMGEITFTLQVRDTNTEVGSGIGTTQITIIIRGQVDTSIRFDPVNQVFMNEDAPVGYSPIRVTARDPNNSPVTNYRKISGSSYFDVESTTGIVKLIREVDYESNADIAINHVHTVVIAGYSSNMLQSATVTVSIAVVDVNDNDPQFQRPSYEAEVPETAKYPFVVLSIFATDADSRSFGPLGFTLSGLDSDDFSIFPDPVPSGPTVSRRGQVIVAQGRSLDFNRRSQYDLIVTVADNQNNLFSNVHRYDAVPLTIKIIDVNNNVPQFKEGARKVTISETAAIGQNIVTIIGTDADRGLNGEIIFSLEAINDTFSSPGLALFTIGPQSGIVSVARSLITYGDRTFSFFVRATDRGSPPQSNTTRLDIYVLSTQENDGFPKWRGPPNGFIVFAPEETANYTITNNGNSRFLDAIPTTGTNITYSLSPYSDNAKDFRLNPLTAELIIVNPLDRELKPTYTLLIYAEDTSNPANLRTGRQIVVALIDINDNNATFTNPRNYSSCTRTDRPLVIRIEENLGPNVTVYTLKACDPDAGDNAIIYYQFYNVGNYCISNNARSALIVEPDGRLVTARNIDYEEDKEFIICVQAGSSPPVSVGRKKREFDRSQIDPQADNVAYVDVIILDRNDNGPKFPSPETIGIVRTSPDSGPVLTLNAPDPDGSGYNVTIYRIESSVFYPQGDEPPSPFIGAFVLRGEKGAMYASLPSYQAYSGGRFELKVTATDSYNSSFTTSQTVIIYVYERGQAAKVILDLTPPVGSKYAEPIVSELDDVSRNYRFVYLRVSEHVTLDSVDFTKTDVCFLVIDTNSKDLFNIKQVVDLLDRGNYQKILNKNDYHYIDRGQCFPTQSSEASIRWRNLWWVLVAIAIFIFVCCVILIVLVCILYDRYKRYMETRKNYLVSQ